MSDDHSSLDELADLDEGLLQPSRADEVRAHLAGCAACRDRHQALRDVHDELAVLPPETMPPGVVDRLDQALAAAAGPRSATIVPLAPVHDRRHRSWPTLAGVAAGIVGVGFVGALVVGVLHSGASSSGGSAASPESAAGAAGLPTSGQYTTTVSPKTFTHNTVPTGIPQLVAGTVVSGGPLASGSGTATPGANQPSIRGNSSVPKALRPLYDSPTKLLNCAAEVAPVKGSLPEAVVFGRYANATRKASPSVFFVFADGTGRGDITVVGPSCAGTDQILDYFRDVAVQ